MKQVFILAVVLSTLSQLMLAFFNSNWQSLCVTMLVYFVAFNILEATLPSQISRQADTSNKGTAMGIYSSSQFLGIFAGGALAGVVFHYAGNNGIFMFNAGVGLLWIVIAAYIKPNAYQLTHTISFNSIPEDDALLTETLLQLPGVNSVSISRAEQKIHLRIEKANYVKNSAEAILTLDKPA